MKPNITPTTKAVWQFAGRLHPLIQHTGGIGWTAYIGSGGEFHGGRPEAK